MVDQENPEGIPGITTTKTKGISDILGDKIGMKDKKFHKSVRGLFCSK